MTSGTTRMGQRPQKVDCFAQLYDMTKTTTEPVCMYFVFAYPYDMTKTTTEPISMYFYACKINIH